MGKVIPVFAGYDGREAVGYHTFCQSVIENSTEPVSILPLSLSMMGKVYGGGQRDGTNEFIYSRFLIPYLMGYEGFAIFVDGSDMLCRGDLAELWALRDELKAVQVVQHDYKTKHPRKYVGSAIEAGNEDYPRKNWSSVMIMNFAHFAWKKITPELVAKAQGSFLHRFEFIEDRFIGSLPIEWNWLADEYGQNQDAKLLHWTAGIPAFKGYEDAMHANEWFRVRNRANHIANRAEVMSG